MDLNIYYNNKVLSAQEREGFRIISEETIRDFSESIEGFYELSQEFKPSQNKEHDKITKTILDVGIFTSYTFCDCVALLKHLVLSSNSLCLRMTCNTYITDTVSPLVMFTVLGEISATIFILEISASNFSFAAVFILNFS